MQLINRENNTHITVECNELITSRLIVNKQYLIKVRLLGDVEDFILKCERVCSLDDSLYIMLSKIQNSDNK